MKIILLIELMASFLENFWGIYLPAKISGKREVNRNTTCIAVVVLTACVWMFNRYAVFSVFTSVVGILLMAITVRILYCVNFLDALATLGFYMLAIYMIDFSLLSFLGAVMNTPDFASIAVNGHSNVRAGFLVLSKIILCHGCFTFLRHRDRLEYIKIDKWPWLIVGIVILGYFVNNTLMRTDIDMLMLWILLLIVVILGVYALAQFSISDKQRRHMILEAERNRVLKENSEILMQEHRANQIFYHELKNHYVIIGSYIAKGKYEKAKEYMKEMELPISWEFNDEITGIESTDIVIQHKLHEARKKGIMVTVEAEPSEIHLTDAELVSLFGNLLNNAIEACTGVEESKRWIKLTIRKVKKMKFIKITNPCKEAPEIKNGVFQTSKDEKRFHGIGLEYVKSLVKKHEGIMDTEYKNGHFSVVITFFN